MRRLVVGTFLTVDGVMQAPGGPDEDRDGGFAHGGWSFAYWDDEMGELITDQTLRAGALLLGRKTYDIFAGYWPTASEEEGAKPLNDAVKHVASRTRPELTWERSQLIEGDVVEGVRALKESDGPELQVHGSGNLLQTLWGAGLVDELRLLTFPVVLGHGKRLFEGGAVPTAFELVSSRTSSTGVVMALYRAAGAPQTGSFGS